MRPCAEVRICDAYPYVASSAPYPRCERTVLFCMSCVHEVRQNECRAFVDGKICLGTSVLSLRIAVLLHVGGDLSGESAKLVCAMQPRRTCNGEGRRLWPDPPYGDPGWTDYLALGAR